MMRLRLPLVLLLLVGVTTSRRRVSQAHKAFEDSGGISWPDEKDNDDSKKETKSKTSSGDISTTSTTKKTTTTTTTEATTTEENTDEMVARMLTGTLDITNLTKLVEKEHFKSLEDATNKTIFWIDANYKAEDVGLNISSLMECRAWQQHWNITQEENKNDTRKPLTEDEMVKYLKETEIVDSKKRLKKLGMKQDLLEEYDGVGIMYSEICIGHSRWLWFNTTEDAKRLGIDEESPICGPFKEDLNPTPEVLQQLVDKLNEIVGRGVPYVKKQKITDGISQVETIKKPHTHGDIEEEDSEIFDYDFEHAHQPVAQKVDIRVEEEPELVPFNKNLQSTLEPGTPAYPHVREQAKEHRISSNDRHPTHTEVHFESTSEPMFEATDSHQFGTHMYEVTDEPEMGIASTQRTVETSSKPPRKRPSTPHTGTLRTAKTFKNEDGSETAHIVEETETEDLENVHDLLTKVEEMEKEHEKEDNEIIKDEEYEDDVYDYKDFKKRYKEQEKKVRFEQKRRRKRMAVENKEEVDDEDEGWVDPSATTPILESTPAPEESNKTSSGMVEMDLTDEINPVLLISHPSAISALGLDVPEDAFLKHEKVGLHLPGVCADYVPKAVDGFNSSSFEGVEIEGPIGVNISALEAAGVNLTELAEKLRNDSEVDDILSRTAGSVKTLGGSFILPVLNKNQYDPFSAPIVFRGSAVVVRFGIYIESMSNFQTTTMDYDMDIYLLMAWRDARLVNPYDKPILVKEEEILEKLWRPDPFFANAKQAEFHEVTFLNFLMRIFPDGLVLYETRVKITPSCNLILCKYPHDKQTCDLLIKSFAYPVETVRFEWFSNRNHAIDKNPHVKLPELYIDRYETTTCDKSRKSGTFSCLRAVFRLKRDVGFHLAQTYIPTSLALMFSWVGVWLPEEFMEGRIGVAITVLLTLSTESAGAREHLPSVSYLKAIDLWFGFITGFVFITLLQTLFVIGFDKKSSQMRKAALKKKSDINEEVREQMLYKAKRYHKIGRKIDVFCRVFYPLCFLIFLILYYFVYTEGRQDDCINRSASFE